MATPFQKPIDVFLDKIERDIDFFRYFGMTDEEAEELAVKRCKDLLFQAGYMLSLRCRTSNVFTDYNKETEEFNSNLTNAEIYLLGSMMYECYLYKDFAKIKLDNVNYTANELKVFDPSNARSTFTAIYKTIVEENKLLLSAYHDTDPKTGGLLSIDYAAYNEED